ncbi:IQ motif and Sec7 domain ArfGEF 1a isoform X1 [Tachysurus ichikawai]
MEGPGQGQGQGPGQGQGQGQGQGPGPGQNPSKAAECLIELNRIIETQHALLERQKTRIKELQLQVAELRSRNEEYKRHLRTCSLQHQHNNNHNISSSALTAIREK